MKVRDELVSAPFVPLRYLVRMNPRPGVLNSAESCYLPMEAISEFGPVDSSRLRPTSELAQGYSYIADGDVAYAKVTPCFENGKGLRAANLPGGYAFATTEITVMRPGKDLDSRYLAWLLQSEEFRAPGESRMSGAGGLKRVPESYAASYRIPLPRPKVQQAIADYLDRETAQIDAFIAKNEELIALLTERRAAVIAEAVTRGIDAAASMKASGVEWLGAIPVHWSVQRLASTIARARNGVWGAEPEGGSEDLRCVRVADFDRPRQRIHDRAHTRRKLSASERAGRVLRRGDLLLEKSGGGEKSPVGFVVLYDRDEPAVCSNFVARVQLREGMDPIFWTYVHGALYRLRITEKSLKQSTGIQNLDQSAYFNEYVAVPPYEEQCAISDYLERRSREIDAAIGTARRGVQLARERRAALISAAVTGKIDLRGSA